MRTYSIVQGSILSVLWWPKWEGNRKKERIYCTYSWFALLHGRDWHCVAKQIYPVNTPSVCDPVAHFSSSTTDASAVGAVPVCLLAQWRPARCNPMDCSPAGSSVRGFFRQEYWNGLPFPPWADLPDPGIEPISLVSPALAGGLFTTEPLYP